MANLSASLLLCIVNLQCSVLTPGALFSEKPLRLLPAPRAKSQLCPLPHLGLSDTYSPMALHLELSSVALQWRNMSQSVQIDGLPPDHKAHHIMTCKLSR